MTTPPQNEAARREMMTPEQAEAVRVERQVLTELMQAKLLRAAYSERQLEEVMVDFWFNHFNVFAGKGQTRVYLTEYERDAIRPHVFGKFRDLLQATAEEPGDALLSRQLAERGARRRAHGGAARRERPDEPAQPEPDARRFRRTLTRPGQTDRQRTLADLPPGPQNRRRAASTRTTRAS